MARRRTPSTFFIVKCVRLLLVTIGISLCMAETSDDPNYAGMLQLDSTNLKIYYSSILTDTGANAVSIKAVYQGLAWLAIGVNPDGEMIGGVAVIGQPNAAISSENPGKYFMTDESSSGVVLMDSSAQTLINGIITQDTSAGTTTLMYTKIMEESGELSINPNGQTTFIWAVGTNNNYPAYHGNGRGKFVLDLSTNGAAFAEKPQEQQKSSKNYTKIFAAHGIMAVIAWAFLTPFAIGISFLRGLFFSALWFKLHMYVNFATFLLTLTTFILAVVNIDRKERFSDPHFIAGWILMGLVTLQVMVGIFRPHVETTHEGQKTSTVWKFVIRKWDSFRSGSKRAIWEVCHKLFGYGILGLAIWQMQSGIKLWREKYGPQNLLTPFWLWIYFLLVFALVLKVWAFRRWSKGTTATVDEGHNVIEVPDELQ
jgi:hypothetical protein